MQFCIKTVSHPIRARDCVWIVALTFTDRCAAVLAVHQDKLHLLRFLLCCTHITWSERVMNFEVRSRTGQPLLSDTVRTRRLKLFGHVARAEKSQDHSHALQACISPAPRNWRRRPGRPRHTWVRTVEEDLRQFNLGLASGLRRAQNRTT